MVTIGIDAVDIERFAHWSSFTKEKLRRIFSKDEIIYCLSNPLKAAERFAVRFAAKEALYKALSSLLDEPISLLSLCKHCEIEPSLGGPILKVNWQSIHVNNAYKSRISLTHTKNVAFAAVIIEKLS